MTFGSLSTLSFFFGSFALNGLECSARTTVTKALNLLCVFEHAHSPASIAIRSLIPFRSVCIRCTHAPTWPASLLPKATQTNRRFVQARYFHVPYRTRPFCASYCRGTYSRIPDEQASWLFFMPTHTGFSASLPFWLCTSRLNTCLHAPCSLFRSNVSWQRPTCRTLYAVFMTPPYSAAACTHDTRLQKALFT